MQEKLINIEGGIIYSPSEILENKRIVIRNGKIEAIEDLTLPRREGMVINAANNLVVPGLIDMHLHGGGGRDFMEGSCQAVAAIKKVHGANGTTSIILSTMSSSLAELDRVISGYHNSQGILDRAPGSEILGFHLEWPLLSPKFAGAQQIDTTAFNAQEFINFITKWDNQIKIITLAPELPQAQEVMEFCHDKGIILAAGHTGADYQQGMDAIGLGVKHFTHFFNAMAPLHHRAPGIIGAVLNYNRLHKQREEGVTVELIADGKHLHIGVITMAMEMVGKDQCILISDASPGAGMQEGSFQLGHQRIEVKEGAAYLANGTLAGSAITLNRALNYLVNHKGFKLTDVLPMATINPARKLGIAHEKGSIQVGKQGDIAIFDKGFKCLYSIINGEVLS